jgi:hypothetical protein
MTGSAKQSSFGAATQKAGLLRRFAPRNDDLKTVWLFEN